MYIPNNVSEVASRSRDGMPSRHTCAGTTARAIAQPSTTKGTAQKTDAVTEAHSDPVTPQALHRKKGVTAQKESSPPALELEGAAILRSTMDLRSSHRPRGYIR